MTCSFCCMRCSARDGSNKEPFLHPIYICMLNCICMKLVNVHRKEGFLKTDNARQGRRRLEVIVFIGRPLRRAGKGGLKAARNVKVGSIFRWIRDVL